MAYKQRPPARAASGTESAACARASSLGAVAALAPRVVAVPPVAPLRSSALRYCPAASRPRSPAARVRVSAQAARSATPSGYARSGAAAMRPPASFGVDITNMPQQLPVMMAGRAIIRVVGRCNEAQENCNLDLSECQLMQVPDAVYHLMRHTALTTCNLSGNVITKLPPKFAVKFSLITELNVSHNQMSKLPDELCDLAELRTLDISHNAFISLPRVAFKMPKLANLNANHNRIIEVEVERLQEAPSLVEVDLTDNPVLPEVHDSLKALEAPRVLLTEREKEDWEDLTV